MRDRQEWRRGEWWEEQGGREEAASIPGFSNFLVIPRLHYDRDAVCVLCDGVRDTCDAVWGLLIFANVLQFWGM